VVSPLSPHKMSLLSWCINTDSSASWRLDSATTVLLVECLFETLSSHGSIDELAPIPLNRLDTCVRTCSAKHSISWIASASGVSKKILLRFGREMSEDTDGITISVGLRRGGSGLVRWESALVALQRAEGFIMIQHSASVSAWRVSPLACQAIIARLVTEAAALGEYFGTVDVQATASTDIVAYAASTAALSDQIDRVRAGGEPWSIEERTMKLARLEQMSHSYRVKLERGDALTELEQSVVDALTDAHKDFAASEALSG
jgi:hypothetical protein